MMVGTRSRRGWGFGNLGSKRFGHGSCMTVGGFARRRNEQCIDCLRLFLGHCGSRISIKPTHIPVSTYLLMSSKVTTDRESSATILDLTDER
jgi:hypothetical protein